MRILILNWRDPKNPKSGGAEIVTLEHAKAWVKAGHHVTWFTSQFPKSKGKETIEGVKIIRRGNFITTYLHALIYYILNRKSYDLVIDEVHGLPYFTPLYVRKPKIMFIHEVAGEIWDYMYPFPLNKLGKVIEKFYFIFYKNVKVWTDAKSTIDELVHLGIPRKNCTAIACPSLSKPVDKLPKKEIKPTFIFVSRVVKMKGVEEVIKAFFHILKNIKEGQLWIVGDGDEKYLEYLKKTMHLYTISTKVKFFGKVTEAKKLELMRKSHLLLHASRKEGWGLVVLEAASQGTPSIVYNVAGLKDSVKNRGTGLVLSQNNPSEMAKAAIKLINDSEEYVKLQKGAIEWANYFTWDSVTQQSLFLLNKATF